MKSLDKTLQPETKEARFAEMAQIVPYFHAPCQHLCPARLALCTVRLAKAKRPQASYQANTETHLEVTPEPKNRKDLNHIP